MTFHLPLLFNNILIIRVYLLLRISATSSLVYTELILLDLVASSVASTILTAIVLYKSINSAQHFSIVLVLSAIFCAIEEKFKSFRFEGHSQGVSSHELSVDGVSLIECVARKWFSSLVFAQVYT